MSQGISYIQIKLLSKPGGCPNYMAVQTNGWLSQATVQVKMPSKLGGCSNKWLSKSKGQPIEAASQIQRSFSQCIFMGYRIPTLGHHR
jgi:hypothetical protein